jgi:hypothetical protein
MSNTTDALNNLKHDTNDTIDEVKNRAQATGEKVKRNAEGDSMPLGERIVSNVKEVLHKTTADIDAAKRDVRHNAGTTTDEV